MLAVAIHILAFMILVGLVFWVLSKIPGIPDPIRQIFYIILVVLVVIAMVIWMLGFDTSVLTIPAFPHHR